MRWFDLDAGVGTIDSDVSDDGVFFNFTAIPGEGYRTLRPGTPVIFEVVKNGAGLIVRNVQKKGEG